ncbi:very short patch repair endonuclease [Rhizobium laguerreae]|uniref:very short patch repair endonuclease n=1 Tax=Rhizobium laguerreae TaxID=1076926 RepID=UPI001FE42A7D|nr:very short patch repair endonuclease [Rhizobium laguerreae]
MVEKRALAEPVSPGRRRNMQAIKAKNTKPELVIRKLLHSLGYRYRLHAKDLPGRPDIVFRPRKKAVEVRGCFWHRHQGCKNCVMPSTRSDWWEGKLTANVLRDERNMADLAALGWEVLIIWECEANHNDIPKRLINFLK